MCKNIIGHEFYCTKCGKKGIPVVRQKGKERELGHLKALWCLNCKTEVNHVEINPNSENYTYQDFMLEFNNNNFDENGNRILTIGQLKNKLRQEGVIK